MPTRRSFLAGLATSLLATPIPLAHAGGLTLVGTRHDGTPIGPEAIGGWRLVYFGYTFCPDVCPLGLQTMAEALDGLGPIAPAITPVFVTVDPQRDTPEVMRNYVGFFHARIVGLTPNDDELKAMAKAWRVKYAKVEVGEGRPYLMDHTAAILLADPAGEPAGRFPHDIGGARLADKIRSALLSRSPS